MKHLFLLLSLVGALSSFAQTKKIDPAIDPRNYPNGGALLSKDMELCVRSYDISKYEAIDTARVIVSYRKTTVPDRKLARPLNPERMNLFIGDRTTWFLNVDLALRDSVYTADKDKGLILQYGFSFVYRDIPARRIREVIRVPFAQDQAIFYREPEPDFAWQLGTADTVICGYRCTDATATFRGREWRVWFAPELPFSAGPWKLSGLPGLILRAVDRSGMHTYEAVGIRRETRIIPLYKWHMKEMTRSKWFERERKMYENPFSYVDQNTLYIGGSGRTAEDAFLNESNWKNAPYFPLELE